MRVIIDENFEQYIETIGKFADKTIELNQLNNYSFGNLIKEIIRSTDDSYIICPVKNKKENYLLVKCNGNKLELLHNSLNEHKQVDSSHYIVVY